MRIFGGHAQPPGLLKRFGGHPQLPRWLKMMLGGHAQPPGLLKRSLGGHSQAPVFVLLLLVACAPAPAAPRAESAAASAPAVSNQAAAPPPLETVHFVYGAPSESFALPSVGKAFGVFARHGIDLEAQLVTGTPRLVQSLVAGDFQFGQGGVTALTNARLRGADVIVVAGLDNYSSQALLVAPGSTATQLEQLRGRTIGVSQFGSESDEFLRIALATRSNLRADQDVSVLQTGGHPQTAAALISGNIDAGVISGAIRVSALRAGARQIADARTMEVLAFAGTVATSDRLVAERPDLVRRFLRALTETIALYKSEPDRAVDALVPFLGDLDRPTVELLYAEHAPTILRLPRPSLQSLQAVLDRNEDPRARELGPEHFVNFTFVDEIERDGFLARLYP